MIRNLTVEIDQNSWPQNGPPFPATFPAGLSVSQVNVASMLLLIGQLTTPTYAGGMSLSEFWAYVRYFYAIADTNDLRLTPAFSALDSHQKTILSDDFGMGVPVQWLIDHLQLTAWCDGREFAERFGALTQAAVGPTARRGPQKSPDFVFLDQGGLYHVVECKGTQSGRSSRARQISHNAADGTPSGAVVQKMMIVLQPAFQGQRLACGLSIAVENGRGESDLYIQDPDSLNVITVKSGEEPFAEDPLIRGSVSRALRAAGLPAVAAVAGSPSGNNPSSRRADSSRKESARLGQIETRLRAANEDLQSGLSDRSFMIGEKQYVGRDVTIELPRPLVSGRRIFNRVIIKQGVERATLSRLQEGALTDSLISVVSHHVV